MVKLYEVMEKYFSSEEDTWETPKLLFDELNTEFNFTLDPCCSNVTAKCSNFYTKLKIGNLKEYFVIHLTENNKLKFGLKNVTMNF